MMRLSRDRGRTAPARRWKPCAYRGLTAALCALAAGSAAADPISQSAALPSQTTDWSSSVAFDKFDPSLGVLNGIKLQLDSTMTSTIAVESRELSAGAFTAGISGSVTVSRPDNTPIATASPYASKSATLGAFDGAVDFGGTSGFTQSGLTATSSTTTSGVLTASDRTLFTGPGVIDLPVRADARVVQNGPANMVGQIDTRMSAAATLTYDVGASASGSSTGGSDGLPIGVFTYNGVGGVIRGIETAPQIVSLAPQTTGWNSVAKFEKFNPALGDLFRVNIKLTSKMTGDMAFENLGSTGGFLTADQYNFVAVRLLDGAYIAGLETRLTKSMTLSKFDGIGDFAGASGEEIEDRVQEKTTHGSISDAARLHEFEGDGFISLPVISRGRSVIDGPGNLMFDLAAIADATIELRYTYFTDAYDGLPTVPEPATLGLLALPLLALGAMRRRVPSP